MALRWNQISWTPCGSSASPIIPNLIVLTLWLTSCFQILSSLKHMLDATEAGDTLRVNHSPLQMGWGSWTACSASCGGGIKVRARYPSIKSFREKDTEVKKCNVEPCDKMDAAWSEWGLWDDCSVTCGGGARIRFRYCKKHGASARSGCPGKRYEVELCNVETCPEEGGLRLPTEIDKDFNDIILRS